MKTEHTAGPWEAKASEAYAANTGKTVARCDIGGRDAETDANAQLCAAAPDLFRVLERILAAHESDNNGAVMGEARLCRLFELMARDTINKAKGQ